MAAANWDFLLKRQEADGRPAVCCGPMWRGSELAFRMLVRRHGVPVCYTPMLKAEQLLKGGWEETALLQTCPEDRPLVVQLASGDPEALAKALNLVLAAMSVDAVDLNLGCPQECAECGNFGAFLGHEGAAACVAALRAAAPADLPVACKLRLQGTAEESCAYARRLVAAGASLLAVHGRQRAAKHNGPVDLEQLRAVAESVAPVPVVANGDVLCRETAAAALAATGARAAMAARALLACPRAFGQGEGSRRPAEMAMEYLDFAERFPPPSALYVRKHLRWIFRSELQAAHTAARAAWESGEAERGQGAEGAEWRVKAWTFLEQNCLEEVAQFRELVRLVAHEQGAPLDGLPVWSFSEIRRGRRDAPSDDEEGPEFSLDFD